MTVFLKHHRNAHVAAEALRRSRLLAGQGVLTPVAQPGPSDDALLFEHIDGVCGIDLVADNLDAMLALVHDVHQTTVPELPIYDPFLRIRPRLGLSTDVLVRAIVEENVPAGDATLHGDLHVGQFLRDGAGAVWIVDVDDMAIGPPEADLANFTAHLATSEPRRGIDFWARSICTRWRDGGRELDQKTFEQYLRFALVRRHLKLRERGRDDFESDVAAFLSDSSPLN